MPDAPNTPKVTEVGQDFVALHWDTPDSDGGAPIKGYIIERYNDPSAFLFLIKLRLLALKDQIRADYMRYLMLSIFNIRISVWTNTGCLFASGLVVTDYKPFFRKFMKQWFVF